MSLEIENQTNEQIKVEYSIRDDLLSDGYDKNVVQILNTNEKNQVVFSWDYFYDGPVLWRNEK
jgi:uncharacterized protein (DUF2249 family)